MRKGTNASLHDLLRRLRFRLSVMVERIHHACMHASRSPFLLRSSEDGRFKKSARYCIEACKIVLSPKIQCSRLLPSNCPLPFEIFSHRPELPTRRRKQDPARLWLRSSLLLSLAGCSADSNLITKLFAVSKSTYISFRTYSKGRGTRG